MANSAIAAAVAANLGATGCPATVVGNNARASRSSFRASAIVVGKSSATASTVGMPFAVNSPSRSRAAIPRSMSWSSSRCSWP